MIFFDIPACRNRHSLRLITIIQQTQNGIDKIASAIPD